MPTKCQTGVGRIVWGNPTKSQPKRHQEGEQKGKPILKEGKEIPQWAFGVAFPKQEFARDVYPAMSQEASSGYPQGFPPKFAWKYQDGDSVDSHGVPYSKREGYAGCYILTISTEAFAPPIFRFVNGLYVQVGHGEIKTGDYVALALNFQVNVPTSNTRTPSLYVNPQGIELVGYGTEIVSGPDPQQLFGGRTYQLPPGASATPVSGNPGGLAMPGTMMPGAGGGYVAPNGGPISSGPAGMPQGMPQGQPGMMQPGMMQPGMQQPMQQPGMMQGMPQGQPQYQQPGMPQGQPGMMQPGMPQQPGMIAPAHDFVQNAGMQQPGGMPQGMPQGQPQYQQQMQPQGQYVLQPGMPGYIPPR